MSFYRLDEVKYGNPGNIYRTVSLRKITGLSFFPVTIFAQFLKGFTYFFLIL
ncbi:MAG: hypothetical protein H6Q19_1046 [Bacteroidetes bacterium]|nr:hypothetical protein [Bacteroidota bacterium]